MEQFREEIQQQILPYLSDTIRTRMFDLICKEDYDKIQKFFMSWNFIKPLVGLQFNNTRTLLDLDNYLNHFPPNSNYFYYPILSSSERDFFFLRIEKRIWLLYCNHYLSDFSKNIYESVRVVFKTTLNDIITQNYSQFFRSPLSELETIESNENVVINNVSYPVREINKTGRYKDNKLSYLDLLVLQKNTSYSRAIETRVILRTDNSYLKVEFKMNILDILFYNYTEYSYLNDPIVSIENTLLNYANKITENKTEKVFRLELYLNTSVFLISNMLIFFSNKSNNHKYYFVPTRFGNPERVLKKKFKYYYETKSLSQQSAELIFDNIYSDSETEEEFRTKLLKAIETVNKLDFLRIADSSFFMVEHFFISEYKKYTNSSENFEKNISIDHIDNVLNIMLWRLEKYEAFKIFCKNTREYFGKLFKFFYVLKVPI